jgi:hypothetical protein
MISQNLLLAYSVGAIFSSIIIIIAFLTNQKTSRPKKKR